MAVTTTTTDATTTETAPLPILIAGAGLASLLLAQALRGAGIPFLIYERDASVSFRAQGYRLRLSREGLAAIESVLEPEHWKLFWDTCGKTNAPKGAKAAGFTVIDALTGEELPSLDVGGGGGEPGSVTGAASGSETDSSAATTPPSGNKSSGEILLSRDGKIVGISRGDMRRLFMQGCETNIQWSHTVTGYEHSTSPAGTTAGVRAIFADGTRSVLGSMLIGGEGIYSKTAKQVSGGRLKVYDTGARGIHGQAPTTAFKSLGEGVWALRDESHPKGGVFMITNVRAGDMDDPSLNFGWTMGAVPGVINPPGDNFSVIGQPAADVARDLAKNWHPRVRPLVDQMIDSEAAFWKITCSTPSGVPEWENDERVTVIGDAVHSMTPAGGNGANTALRDSALLGGMIAKAGGWRQGLTREYEEIMRVYGSEEVHKSYSSAAKQWGVNIDEHSLQVG
ncbi:FAD-binding domain protein [Microdochium trichocladiopsis]|uniref:FAD-binding domain protein n=1 Tax=Microdochium trichocladiopsis TaxID=1682393 RepID=A0A9P8XRR5_9PEZI|nr:FAD-binding domain protein [Microdochium trichocladiopsis]KAH7014197.1 FAD-binding domain protein [Microdochium trichocladiopsis]